MLTKPCLSSVLPFDPVTGPQATWHVICGTLAFFLCLKQDICLALSLAFMVSGQLLTVTDSRSAEPQPLVTCSRKFLPAPAGLLHPV